MSFYEGNALLDYVSKEGESNFIVPSSGIWHLVYSDDHYRPIWQFHVADLRRSSIGKLLGLPRFPGINGLDLAFDSAGKFSAREWPEEKWREFNSESLYEYFYGLGLVTAKNITTKRFNSASSSVYHIWQMNNKFIGGVTDIDLYRIDENRDVVELFEIKRSKISLEMWRPYVEDRGGYEILHNLAKMCNVDLTILYYEFDREKEIENINEIQIFKKLDGFRFEKGAKISSKELIKAPI